MRFEQLDVWKRACRLSRDLYKELKNCRDYGLRDQMIRAAVSIPSNIAEGEERESTAESARFLYFAKGSSGELITQIYCDRNWRNRQTKRNDAYQRG